MSSQLVEIAKQEAKYTKPGLIGKSYGMQIVYDLIGKAGGSRANVLISGETGTGKELVARAIHESSSRRSKPCIIVNCAAIPDTLLESELFGYERGAFTGAVRDHKGKFELAHQSTLYLDEIGDMSPNLQAKILRAVEYGSIASIGNGNEKKVDVRIIAATNKDIGQIVQEGKFRDDLFYRLNILSIHLPPLRSRKEDIPLLVEHFFGDFCSEYGKKSIKADDEALTRLAKYDWPGNVRELRNLVEKAVAYGYGDSGTLTKRDVDRLFASSEISLFDSSIAVKPVTVSLDIIAAYLLNSILSGEQNFYDTIRMLKSKIVGLAIVQTGGNQVQAGKLLQIPRSSVSNITSKND
ncbi:sigma-54-dependent Fis family transcriptional regulator [Candidatus Woesearchaeota archaeon]|nr:sigma-54-dependent Fis family transcriptional regulator [Candidatus Woesearchaeota archaeon]